MKKRNTKNQKRPEFNGKSAEYQDGYKSAEDYFKICLDGGKSSGGAIFRIFVGVVAQSIRNKEVISIDRIDALECILEWSNTDFNLGVRDFLLKAIEDYNKEKVDKNE